MNTFINQGHIKLIKSNNKDIILEKITVSNKCCIFTFSSSKNFEKRKLHFYKSSTTFNIDKFLAQQISVLDYLLDGIKLMLKYIETKHFF